MEAVGHNRALDRNDSAVRVQFDLEARWVGASMPLQLYGAENEGEHRILRAIGSDCASRRGSHWGSHSPREMASSTLSCGPF